MASLYDCADTQGLNNHKLESQIEAQHGAVSEAKGGDSIMTLFLGVKCGTEALTGRCTAHNFYTPISTGLSALGSWKALPVTESERYKEALKTWIGEYLRLTTYEISIPVLRDASLAPPGSAGMIISTLFDYDLVKAINDAGWYEEFKAFCTDRIIETLDRSPFPLDGALVTDKRCSTPLTLERLTGNRGGAVTGWAFTQSIPAISTMQKVTNAILTPFPDIYQAGHWTFSPSGLPIAVLTGKLAADAVHKMLKSAGAGRSI
jgi:phytoene dehydrogenase-like protein